MPGKNDILMPRAGKFTVSYICPECSNRVERELAFLIEDKSKVEYQALWWCEHRYCEARHSLYYRTRQVKNKPPKMKVLEFTCNDKVQNNKRFRVSEWSGTTNG